MKFYIVMFVIVAIILLIIPMAGKGRDILETDIENKKPPTALSPWQEDDTPTISVPKPISKSKEEDTKGEETSDISRSRTEGAKRMEKEYFKILDKTSGEVKKVSQRDYVRGAVCSEMPATFQLEALKAQAVSAHTYALNLKKFNQENEDPSLKGADFAADPSKWLVYVTEDLARERFGDNFLPYWDKICIAADSVSDRVIVSDNEPIAAAYHAISSGATESAENVWGNGVEYLVPVESSGDLLAPKYEEVKSFSIEEMREFLSIFDGINLDKEASELISIEGRSDSGYVTDMLVGNIEISGLDFREALKLRSSSFKIDFDGKDYNITTSGYGHGVGLSQYGADFMARQGSDWEEIIKHYYKGVEIDKI